MRRGGILCGCPPRLRVFTKGFGNVHLRIIPNRQGSLRLGSFRSNDVHTGEFTPHLVRTRFLDMQKHTGEFTQKQTQGSLLATLSSLHTGEFTDVQQFPTQGSLHGLGF